MALYNWVCSVMYQETNKIDFETLATYLFQD